MKIGIMGLGLMAGLIVCILAVSAVPAFASSPKVVQVAEDQTSTVALLDDGSVWTWGSNFEGELGTGNRNSSFVPVKVGISNVTCVAAGGNYVLAVRDDGTVWGWGTTAYNCLGAISDKKSLINIPFTAQSVLLPIQVQGLSNITKVAAGGLQNIALDKDGRLWVWGCNGEGQLGLGYASSSVATPVRVNIGGVKDIACTVGDIFILKNDGMLWAAGDGEYGQMGNGSTNGSDVFVQVPLTNVTAIGCGSSHVIAVKDDGTLWSWGDNWDYETGSISDRQYQPVPVNVQYIDGVKAVASGAMHSLALKDDGTVWVWGRNAMATYGLGDECGSDSMYPVKVDGLGHVAAIYAGSYQNYAIMDDGTLWAWGWNDEGEVGVGTIPDISGHPSGNSWNCSVVVPTKVFFDQPDRQYRPYIPSPASPTPIPSVMPLSSGRDDMAIKENWSITNNISAQYIAAGDNGSIYTFDHNTIDRYDSIGKLQWSLTIPDKWNITKSWYRAVYFKISVSQGGSIAPYPVFDTHDGYLYLYAPPNVVTPNPSNGYLWDKYFDPDDYEWDVIAVSPDGKIAWTLPLKSDVTATDDADVRATSDRVYIFYDYNETVLDKSGNVLFTLPDISDPAAIDDNGNLYVTPAESRYWPSNEYPIAGKDIYADFRTPSTSVEAYGRDGTLLWHKDVGMMIERQYVTDNLQARYGTSPLYQNDTLYVMSERQVMALDLNGSVKWVKTFDEGLYKLFEEMPVDSHGRLYLENIPLKVADVINTTLLVLGPDGNEVCPPRTFYTNFQCAAYDGILYKWDQVGVTGVDNIPLAKPLGNDSLYDLPTDIVTAYDIINNTMLWQYEMPTDNTQEKIIDSSNARDVIEPQYASVDISSLMAKPGEDISDVNSNTWISLYPTGGVIYISFMSRNMEEPVVLGKSRAVYSSGIYALNNNGVPVLDKPTGSFANLFALNNGTIYFMGGSGGLSAVTVGMAASGIALVAAALVLFKFIGIGTVARARSRLGKNRNRNAMMDFIVRNPGVTMADISRSLAMNLGTVRYHLLILGINHRIATFKDDNRFVRYFPNSNRYSREEQLLISLLRRDGVNRVLTVMYGKPGLTNLDLSNETGLPRSAITNYLKELAAKGVVEKKEMDAGRYTYYIKGDALAFIAKLPWALKGTGGADKARLPGGFYPAEA